MAKVQTNHDDETVELLRKILIVQLGVAGVSRENTRKIVGCDMHLVSRVQRHVKAKKEGR